MKLKSYKTTYNEEGLITLRETGAYNIDGRRVFNNPDFVAKTFAEGIGMASETEEYSWLACMDTKFHCLGVFELGHGWLDGCAIDTRGVFQKALLVNAMNLILLHNHPSGDPSPSKDDLAITETLKKARELMGIKLCDHIIISGGPSNQRQYYSISGQEYGCY